MQRKHLTFDCLEDRWLPSVVVLAPSPPVNQFVQHSPAQQDLDEDSTSGETEAVVSTASPGSANAALVGSAAASAPGSSLSSDDSPAEDAADLVEGASPSWNARTDADWAEDIREHGAASSLTTNLSVLVSGSPLLSRTSESRAADVGIAAVSNRISVAQTEDVDAPRVKMPAEHDPEMTAPQVHSKDIPEAGLLDQPATVKLAPHERKISTEENVSALDAASVPELTEMNLAVELIQDVGVVNLEAIEAGMRRFLNDFEEGVERMFHLSDNKSLVPWVTGAIFSAAALELARRQLRCPTTEIESAALRITSSGLRFRRTSKPL